MEYSGPLPSSPASTHTPCDGASSLQHMNNVQKSMMMYGGSSKFPALYVISAAARARTGKREVEAGQKAAELRAHEITKELENTTIVFELHMEELRAKQDEVLKRDK